MGRAYNHIKTFELASFPYQEISLLKACWVDMLSVCWGGHWMLIVSKVGVASVLDHMHPFSVKILVTTLALNLMWIALFF